MSYDWSVVAKRWGGGIFLALAAFMFIGFMAAGGTFSAPATIAAFIIAVLLPAGTGAMLIRSSLGGGRHLSERQEALRLETVEAEVLRLAGKNGGRLTIVETAGALGIQAEEAEKVLRHLMAKEVADVAVSDSGLLVYTFHDITVLGEKEEARGLLDAGPDPGFGAGSGGVES